MILPFGFAFYPQGVGYNKWASQRPITTSACSLPPPLGVCAGLQETTRPEKWVRVLGPLGGLSRGSDFMYPTVGLTMGYVGFRMRIILSDRII